MSNNLDDLEKILKDLAVYEKNGLDTSYLKSFIKQFKLFLKINNIKPDISNFSDDKKLLIVREIMSNEDIFPTIADIIDFANKKMGVEFKSQKASRNVTIDRIIGRVEKDPEFKQKLKSALILLIEDSQYNKKPRQTQNKAEEKSINLNHWVSMLKEL